MNINTDDLLNKVNEYRALADSTAILLQDARTREAIIADQMDKLTAKLQEVAGTVDWSSLASLIHTASETAQQAVESLVAALDNAGVSAE